MYIKNIIVFIFLIWTPLLFARQMYSQPTALSVEELKKMYPQSPSIDWSTMNNTPEAKEYRTKYLQWLTEVRTAYKNKQMTQSRLIDFERQRQKRKSYINKMGNLWPYIPPDSTQGSFRAEGPYGLERLLTSEDLEVAAECINGLKPLPPTSKDLKIKGIVKPTHDYQQERYRNRRYNKFTLSGIPLFPYYWRASSKEWEKNPKQAQSKNQAYKDATKLWRDSRHWIILAQEDKIAEKAAKKRFNRFYTKLQNNAIHKPQDFFKCRADKRREMALKLQNEAFSLAKKSGAISDASLYSKGNPPIEGGSRLDIKMARCMESIQRVKRRKARRELLKNGSEFKNISCTPLFSSSTLSKIGSVNMWYYSKYNTTWPYSPRYKGPRCYDRTLSKPPVLDIPQDKNRLVLQTEAEKVSMLKQCWDIFRAINGRENASVSQIKEQFGSCIKQKKQEATNKQREELERQGYDQIQCEPYAKWFDSFIFVKNDKATLNFNTQTIGLGGCTGYNTKTKKKSSWPISKTFLTASCEKNPLLVSKKIENNELCFYGSYKEQLYGLRGLVYPKVWTWRDDQVPNYFRIGTGNWSWVKNSNGELIGRCFHPNYPTGRPSTHRGSE